MWVKVSPSNSWPGLHSQGLRAGIWELVGFRRLDRSEDAPLCRSHPAGGSSSTVNHAHSELAPVATGTVRSSQRSPGWLGDWKGLAARQRGERSKVKKDDKVNQRNVNCEVYTVDDGGLGQLLAGPSVCMHLATPAAGGTQHVASVSFISSSRLLSSDGVAAHFHPLTPTFHPVRRRQLALMGRHPLDILLLQECSISLSYSGVFDNQEEGIQVGQSRHTPYLHCGRSCRTWRGQNCKGSGLMLWPRQGSQPCKGHTAPAWPSPSGAQGI